MISVVVSAEAEADIDEIGEFIAQDNPDRAVTFVTGMRAKIQKIGLGPNAYPPRRELSARMRAAVYGRYNIYFEVDETQVRVLRVIHGARDLRRVFPKA